jgi:putative oxidoreductase
MTIKLYALLIKLGRFAAPLALLFIRLTWGYYLALSGWGHLHNIDKTTKFFESLHIPMAHANVLISGTTELVGGALFMIGFGTRLISIPVFFNFCVAYLTASRDKVTHIFDFANDGLTNFIDDSAFPFLVIAMLLFAVGPGLISVDGILACTVFKSASTDARRGFPVLQM